MAKTTVCDRTTWAAREILCHGFVVLQTLLVLFANLGFGETPSFSEFSFVVEPSDTIAVRQQSALLNCLAHHEADQPTMQWKRDGDYMNFEGDNRRHVLTNGSLYFNQIEHTRTNRPDEGVYQCVASIRNLGTIVSRNAKLEVAYIAGSFNTEPQSLTIHLGDVAMFACDINGAPKPTIVWQKDERNINLDNSKYVAHADGVLEIRKVEFADLGRYRCQATNIERTRTSRSATLSQNSDTASYQGVPPRFVMTSKDRISLESSTAVLHCGANGRDRQGNLPTITWLKDGITIDIAGNSRISVVGQGSLKIVDVQESDSGSYTCRATNAEDSEDAEATLTVHVPPTFRKQPHSVIAHVKSDVEFECDVYGVPEPTIRWIKNGEYVTPSDYFQIVDGKNLKILGLVDNDDGIYQCISENKVGNIQASAQLVIAEQAALNPTTPQYTTPHPHHHLGNRRMTGRSLPSSPRSLTAALVSTRFVTLSWSVPENEGSSPVRTYSIYWSEEGSDRERVQNTTNLETNIQHLKPATRYEFRVFAYNDAGPSQNPAHAVAETQGEVTVPGPPQNLRAMALSPTSIKISFDPPEESHGRITAYKLYYYQVGENGQLEVDVTKTGHVLTDLNKFRQYSFRVVAFNSNGAGISTDEVLCKTYSDVPSQPPQNGSLEVTSSTSIMVRWEPPPEDGRNGVINGYKIRYKKRGGPRGDTVTTDGNRRTYDLEDLEKGKEYLIRLQALSVNGSSPPTAWLAGSTYLHDLDESRVPGRPQAIDVRAMSTSAVVSFLPPPERDIMVRNYILSYGVGSPFEYKQLLDSKTRYHTIKSLQPSTEYVLSLVAINNAGEGQPIYETVFTRQESTAEPLTPMTPPLGLKARVLSSTTIMLTWTDDSLGRNQRITDNRYYTIRYKPRVGRKYKTVNSTDLNAHFNDLRPNTEYEFSVKVTKGRRQSIYSMSILNKTMEAAPATAPRDLTPVPVEQRPTWVMLNWQPPKFPNGQVTGYLIFYTTDSSQEDREWVVEGVMGDKLSTVIKDLTPDTTYYFKVQARNGKGYGPTSPTVIFRTPNIDGTGGGMIQTPDDYDRRMPMGGKDGKTNKDKWDKLLHESAEKNIKDGENVASKGIHPMIMWISIACVGGVTAIAVVVVTIILCRRRAADSERKKRQGGYKKSGKAVKGGPKEYLKPPDLWIHHEQMELKSMDKSNRESTMTVTPIPRDSQEITKSMDDVSSGDRTLDKRNDERYQRTPVRPKPIMIPVEQPPPPREPIATAVPNGHLTSPDSSGNVGGPTPVRPVYPRTQYTTQYSNTPRGNAQDPPPQYPGEDCGQSTAERRKARGDKMRKHSGSSGKLTGLQSPDSPSCLNQHAPVPYEQLSPPDQLQPPPAMSSDTMTTEGTKSLPRLIHPLKSFSVPGPPLQSAPNTPTPRHIVKPTPQQPTSPYKKPPPPTGSTSTPAKSRSPMPVVTPRAPDVTLRNNKEDPDVPKSISTEELSAEMANLEGLMKDLNAITQQEFEC